MVHIDTKFESLRPLTISTAAKGKFFWGLMGGELFCVKSANNVALVVHFTNYSQFVKIGANRESILSPDSNYFAF